MIISLCSGTGGLDLPFGDQVAYHCEIDPDACKVLAARFPGVPNLGSIRGIDWAAVPQPVDGVIGGPPCQPASVAGKRLGANDPRWLWPEAIAAVRVLRPRWLFFENPTGLRPWLGEILGALAALGYDLAWDVFRASDVGAPHRRDRLFILGKVEQVGVSRRPIPAEPEESPAATPYPLRPGQQGIGSTEPAGSAWASDTTPAAFNWVDAEGRDYGPAVRQWERLHGPYPHPIDDFPGFREWLMGLPVGWTDVGISKTARIRLTGNAVVPQVAALAWSVLSE